VEGEQRADRLPGRRIAVEEQQARGVVAETELASRAQHAVGRDAAHLRRLDRDVPGQDGSGPRVRRSHADGDVRCAAHDLAARLAVIDDAYRQLVRIRVGLALDDVPDDATVEPGPGRLDLVDLEPRRRQLFGEPR